MNNTSNVNVIGGRVKVIPCASMKNEFLKLKDTTLLGLTGTIVNGPKEADLGKDGYWRYVEIDARGTYRIYSTYLTNANKDTSHE